MTFYIHRYRQDLAFFNKCWALDRNQHMDNDDLECFKLSAFDE